MPKKIKEAAIKKLEILEKNPLYPSLKLHSLHWKLNWLWSISLNNSYRVIFEPLENWDILLVSIWTHSIY